MLTVRIQVIDGTGTFTLSDSQPCRLLTSLHRHYPASAVLRTSPPPQGARPVPRGLPVGRRSDHAVGLPVLRMLSLCTCCRHYSGAASGRTSSLTSPSRISLPRKGRRVGLRIVLFEVCSAFTRVTACTLAPSPIRDALSEGFSHFVTSIAAPVASGWERLPGGTYTHWKAPPFHGAHSGQTSRQVRKCPYRTCGELIR